MAYSNESFSKSNYKTADTCTTYIYKTINKTTKPKLNKTATSHATFYNHCYDTSDVGLPQEPSTVVYVNTRKPTITIQPPKVYVVYPTHGIQHDKPALPSYSTQVSNENGLSEITPSFASLTCRQNNGTEEITETVNAPSSETQNNVQPYLTNVNNSQIVRAAKPPNAVSNNPLTNDAENNYNSQRVNFHQNTSSESRPPARHPDYRNYYQRLLSFTNWPGYARQDPTHLCQAGFFYTGNVDLVRCYHCGIGLKDFRQDDVPLVEHVRYSSNCEFLLELLGPAQLSEYKRNVLENKTNQITVHQQQELPHQRQEHQFAHQAKMTTPPANTITRDNAKAPSQQNLRQQGHYSPITTNTAASVTYRHPEYALMDTRLASFAKWPPGILQTPRQIAEAGFYYTGMSDVVRCWVCDGGLQKWDPQDDPWIEHCYYFPTCPYAIQQKGSGYIALVQQHARGDKTGEKNHTPATNSSEHQNDWHTHDNMQKMAIKEHNPVFETVAGKQLFQMGYDKKTIRRAIEKLRKQGTKDSTVEQIVDIIGEVDKNISLQNNKQTNEMLRTTSEVLHENERLKSLLLCMACNENNVNVLFLPCTHHRMCTICAETVTNCPLCSRLIKEKVKTFMP